MTRNRSLLRRSDRRFWTVAGDTPPTHAITLKANWNPDASAPITGWRAACSCGWEGVEQDGESSAAHDGRLHLRWAKAVA
jgi:hypothetical protein